MSWYDEFMADTVGVGYRAATGNVDPWTKAEIIDDGVAAEVAAGGDPDAALAGQTEVVTDTLKTFTLGGDDRVGADPSQAHLSLPSFEALKKTFQSLTHDNGEGCGITNLGGCFTLPSWVMWAGAAVVALGALYVLAPYVGVADRLTRRS
jgi:hypothetical protein